MFNASTDGEVVVNGYIMRGPMLLGSGAQMSIGAEGQRGFVFRAFYGQLKLTFGREGIITLIKEDC